MHRPRALTLLMWLSAAAAVLIVALSSGIITDPPMGGTPAEARARIGALLGSLVALLLGMTAVGLFRHRGWARVPILCLWPLILIAAIGCGAVGVVTATVAVAAVVGAIALAFATGWLLFRHKPSVDYFAAVDRR